MVLWMILCYVIIITNILLIKYIIYYLLFLTISSSSFSPGAVSHGDVVPHHFCSCGCPQTKVKKNGRRWLWRQRRQCSCVAAEAAAATAAAGQASTQVQWPWQQLPESTHLPVIVTAKLSRWDGAHETVNVDRDSSQLHERHIGCDPVCLPLPVHASVLTSALCQLHVQYGDGEEWNGAHTSTNPVGKHSQVQHRQRHH